MSNIFDYIQWRGDLSFEQDAFNCIDSLILSRLAYIRWEEIFENSSPLTLKQAYMLYANQKEHVYPLLPQDPDLLEACAKSNRFKDCKVSDFVNVINEEDEIQFCAIMFHLPSFHYVAFRGTDNTVVGWKEDFKMSYQRFIASHKKSKEYLKQMCFKYRGKMYIGGHSKGGNLAMYCSLSASKRIQRRIVCVDSFDGPGLHDDFYERNLLNPMMSKIHIYVPQCSIIGRFLKVDEEDATIIESSQKGIFQHDLYSWNMKGKKFVEVDRFDAMSERINKAVKQFTSTMTPVQLSACIDVLFDIIASTDEDTFHELSENWIKHSPKILLSLSKLSEEDKKVVLSSIKEFVMSFFVNDEI